MSCEVEFTAQAEDDLADLDGKVEGQVRRKIAEMAASAEIWQHTTLTGPYRGYYRLRVGNYRVRYELDRANRRLTVLRAQHRSEAYRAGKRTVELEVHHPSSPILRRLRKASWGTSTRPTRFMRFLPSFCFSSSLRLRVMSPP